jgi:hypothetical protein
MIILNENEKKILENYFLLEKNNSKKDYVEWEKIFIQNHLEEKDINIIWDEKEDISLLMYLAQSSKMSFSNTKIKNLLKLKLDFEYQNKEGKDFYFYVSQNYRFNFFYELVYCNEIKTMNGANKNLPNTWIKKMDEQKLKKNIDHFLIQQDIIKVLKQDIYSVVNYLKVFKYFMENKHDEFLSSEKNIQILEKIMKIKEEIQRMMSNIEKNGYQYQNNRMMFLLRGIHEEDIEELNIHIQYLDLKYNMKDKDHKKTISRKI